MCKVFGEITVKDRIAGTVAVASSDEQDVADTSLVLAVTKEGHPLIAVEPETARDVAHVIIAHFYRKRLCDFTFDLQYNDSFSTDECMTLVGSLRANESELVKKHPKKFCVASLQLLGRLIESMFNSFSHQRACILSELENSPHQQAALTCLEEEIDLVLSE